MTHSERRFVLCGWFFAACMVTAAPADEPLEVALMRPDSLVGWDCGDASPAGWMMAEGRLRGTKGATPLLSAWTFGEFRLRLEWSVADGGVCRILLPEAPSGKAVELTLREGEGCGQLTDGGEQLWPGVHVAAVDDKMHTASIDRAGGKLSLAIDGVERCQVDLDTGRRFGLGLAVDEGEATLARLRATEPPGEPIFNGTDLTGWWTPGNLNAWGVDEGDLMLKDHGGNYLRTEKEYGNFTLSMQYKAKQGCNSGIGLRTPRDGWPSGDGMELQIEDRPGMGTGSTMAIYGNVPPLARADKSEQWNRVVVKADGPMISAWVNGELVQQYNTFHHPELKHRFLKGWIGFQDHGSWIRIRDLRVLEAPDGLGPDTWQKPPPPLATTTLLDRLMNPEQLSVADGLTSGVAAERVEDPGKGEHVLAELAGPGAVVRVARANDQGHLAFFFDGEDKSRLECTPGDLRGALPQLTEDANPVCTCLTYQKSLKIVLRDADQAAYRIDYVTFPEGLPVETFVDRTSGFPRGWLPAVVYRYHRCFWGASREVSPLGERRSEQKTIAPGQAEELVHLDGAGIVRWVRLHAPDAVLKNNDLWLEVTVDGEPEPAVSAPTRFWFPGVGDGQGYYNFVLLRHAGATNMLAMPYADGITLSARNTSDQPIAGVGVTVRVAPAEGEARDEVAGRMRLRGVFQPAQEGSSELVRREGTGRWVGFVYEQPEAGPTGIQELIVDGTPAPGWSAPDLDPLIGAAGESRTALSGRVGPLAWRYLMLAPVEFRESLVLKATTESLGGRLALFYLNK